MSQTTVLPTPNPKPVTIHGQPYHLVAFYYPGHDTAWDKIYQGQCLGNFYACHITMTINGITASFFTAEAAFQATKWWHDAIARKQFEDASDGDAALAAKKKQHSSPDLSYAGLGRDGAMKEILTQKFSDPLFQQTLLLTGQAYLLEHNAAPNRDHYWSDNHDGTGANMLGKTLMEIRALYGGAAAPLGNYKVADFTAAV